MLVTNDLTEGVLMRRLDPRRIEVVDEETASILRGKTPAERLAIAFDAHRTTRLILEARVMREHDDWTPAEVQREVARILLESK